MKTIHKKPIIILFTLFFPLFLFGQQTAVTHQASSFSGVSVSGTIAVVLTQADAYSVEVETTAEQVDDVKVNFRRNTVELSYTGRNRRPDNITVYVSAPEFTQLSSSGAGSFKSTATLFSPSLDLTGSGASTMNLAVDTEHLTTNISGATNLTLSGRALRHDLRASGACLINAYELMTEVSDLNLSGASNARIQVNELLRAEASGASNITYRGNPISHQVTTSGMSRVTGDTSRDPETTEAVVDTVTIRVGQREVQVVDGKTVKTQVSVKRRSLRGSFRDNWSGVELGVNGFLSPDSSIELPSESEQFDLDYRKSVAVNLNIWQQNLVLIGGHLGLVTGIGIGWNNYRFLNNDVMVKGQQSVEFSEGLHDFKKNKLTVTHLNMPLLLEFQTPGWRSSQQFHLSAGMNVGLRIGSHTKQMVFIDGKREKFKDHKDFYLNPFRYDATARIGWGHVNLFASYALNSLFREGRGPELTPFTVGIRLASF